MTKKQIKTELSNEVDVLRSTLADVKAKLPGLDAFLQANPECSKCFNSKAYHCAPLIGKPGCRTCSTRRISCTRHVQYLVETTASRLEWSIEKTRNMYDKHVKQTRSGKKTVISVSKVKKMPTRKSMDVPQTVGSSSTADRQSVVEGKGRKRNVAAAPEENDNYEGEGGSDYQDGPKDFESYTDDGDDDEETEMDKRMLWIKNRPKVWEPMKPRPLPSDPPEETPTFVIPVLEPEEASSTDLGVHDPTSLQRESEKSDTTVPRVDDLTQLQHEKDRNETASAALSGVQFVHTPAPGMLAAQRIKLLEENVARLNALRVVDAASISRLSKKADTAFDNMSVLLSHVRMYRQELGSIVTKHIETAHQKNFKPLIDKMDETSVSATQILMLLDKRKDYEMPAKSRVPVIVTDEEGQEWVPWDVISDDNNLREDSTKRRRDNGAEDEGPSESKRRKC